MFLENHCSHRRAYKVEADFADPIWCADCNWNLDIDDFSISDELREEFDQWVEQYQKKIRLQKKCSSPNLLQFVSEHNEIGRRLAERLEQELGGNVSVTFVPISHI